MSGLNRLSIQEISSLIASKQASACEVAQAHIDEVNKTRSSINAFVHFEPDQVLAQLDHAPQGPLHGIPVTIKDSFDVAGLPTLCGSRFRIGHRASADATSVARLRAAGAILLGKTNCPEFLSNYETDNHIIGRTNNPWNLDRTPGGSSGGEAAAIASFCSAGGIGSDGGGSVRLPAHFCGIAGLKPTPGRIPSTGHFPVIAHPGGLLGVAGPMARSAADLKILFEVLAGYDPFDPFSAPVSPAWPHVQRLRIGCMERFNNIPVHPDALDATGKAARSFTDLGYIVDEFHPTGLERAPNLWSFFFSELAVPFTRVLLDGREHEAHWTGTEFYDKLKNNPEPTGKQVVENLAARDAIRRHVLEQMRDVPVILSPVCSVAAFPHRQRRFTTESKEIGLFQAMMPLTWVNLLGLPAITIPMTVGTDGLPIGIQLIGRPWEEELLLDLAAKLEVIRGQFEFDLPFSR